MPREGHYGERRRRLEAPSAPDSIAAWMRRYLEALQVQGYSGELWRHRCAALARFLEWCEERELQRPGEISKPVLERYQRHLFYARKADGQPLSLKGQRVTLGHVRGWFRWLVKHNHLPSNPAADLDLPLAPRQVLPEALSADEVETVLAQPDVHDAQGLRDRALMELLYSTGLRRTEAANLTVYDLDARRLVRVRQGKGRKDRIVPIGERALAWVQRYLVESRPELQIDPQEMTLFLNRWGQRFSGAGLGNLVRGYLERAGIDKRGACHLFRHAMATQMLENGADVRFIQEMLGHASLDTTQVYTHVAIGKLQAVHAATHPAARLARKAEAKDSEEPDGAA
ncbi:site-specific tyrosine recombinase XerC [Pseudomarimonas arenosa]|uniref:Site-specific tyrosine recombinase XerC n=1 Tax=Pseudomarimonas arenosa TaxID=2774145 RepID=A0AAW3ZRE8_9GAMM|nr:site-specific tyrosine recombinase XerC [Pseudomarimonas arenosa]MBD8528278.1 site-specific tyrosine recombinase XerC [Pseudomarimonas arenosa]